MKKEKGLDEILMDYLLSYLHLSLLFIPEIIVRIVDVEPKSDAQIEFFKKFNFKIHQKLDFLKLINYFQVKLIIRQPNIIKKILFCDVIIILNMMKSKQ